MDLVIASFSRAKSRETTALLAVLAELMLNETDQKVVRNLKLPIGIGRHS
jgi:hypothetical protein